MGSCISSSKIDTFTETNECDDVKINHSNKKTPAQNSRNWAEMTLYNDDSINHSDNILTQEELEKYNEHVKRQNSCNPSYNSEKHA